MPENSFIKVKFMTEKKEGNGEDAPPLLVKKENAYAVGVFDGMGGAGAATCASDYGNNKTKAYIASRIVASAVELFLKTHLSTDEISVEVIKAAITRKLKEEQEKFYDEEPLFASTNEYFKINGKDKYF